MNAFIGGTTTLALAAVLAAAGCAHTYEQDRPPTDALVEGNTGLQAKDVGSATDHMATDLLALPELNASDKKWTIVLSGVTNNTTDPTFSYAVFSDRLRPILLSKGRGRVALIENKAQYHAVQNQELETPTSGPPGQPAGVQPDYALSIKIDEMPNQATSYFLVTASLTNLQTREVLWISPPYEVQTAR
jgi:hypothetical protein